ncbi:MAG: methionine--tRNA ligase [Steroidobacteraceae bacterium]
MTRRILVTSALPYANGSLHLGHIIEAVQTDVWVRYQRMRGNDCIYVCAEDTHGTPIMIRAQSEGISPEALIARVAEEHRADYRDFLVAHDFFHSTHASETFALTRSLYERVRDAGYIDRRNVRQAYDESAGMFLPDRYVRGTCPRCNTADQYGDACENCGATYSPQDLKDPRSTLTGNAPVWRDSEHVFFKLSAHEAMLRDWVAGKSLQPAVRAKLREWFEAGLADWDISRDAPYFGFEIPDAPGKYFYVWFDAPIGYLGSFKALCKQRNIDFDQYFAATSTAELYHFIGKDISYFHTLFWPAVLHSAGLRLPTAVFAHGFLTVNGQKMSKSRGTFITARHYLELLPPEALRYYFAAKLGDGLDDIDLNLEDFVARYNSDIVGKLVNIASRCAPFIARSGGKLSDHLFDDAGYTELAAMGEKVGRCLEAREYSQAIREIMAVADRANQFVDQHKPWLLAKDPARSGDVQRICTQGINYFRLLMTWLAPVLPQLASAAERFLGVSLARWDAPREPLLATPLAAYQPLASRLDNTAVARLIAAPAAPTENQVTDTAAHITIKDFQRVQMRVARVAAASLVEGSDKLLRLTLDLGSEQRTVFSGIRAAYDPDTLVDRLVVVVANLAPRKMRFGVSEGMVLCAGDDDSGIFLLSADSGAKPGMLIT